MGCAVCRKGLAASVFVVLVTGCALLRQDASNFDLTDTMKRKLIRSGAKGTVDYFEWWDNAKGKKRPQNHPSFVLPT